MLPFGAMARGGALFWALALTGLVVACSVQRNPGKADGESGDAAGGNSNQGAGQTGGGGSNVRAAGGELGGASEGPSSGRAGDSALEVAGGGGLSGTSGSGAGEPMPIRNCEPSVGPRACDPHDTRGRGICTLGAESCVEELDGSSNWAGECIGAVAPGEEVCDGAELDENCDGVRNEGCACTDGATRPCGDSDAGICKFGTTSCENGVWSATCVGEVEARSRDCSSSADNDCDGFADNQTSGPCACAAGTTRPCKTTEPGVCMSGTEACLLASNKQGTRWSGTCIPITSSSRELCNNENLDEDCDGTVNENDACADAHSCTVDRCQNGVCRNDLSGGQCLIDGECASAARCNCRGSGVWFDPATELCWEASPQSAENSRDGSLRYCENLSVAGYVDWRLPSIEELISIMRGCDNGAPGPRATTCTFLPVGCDVTTQCTDFDFDNCDSCDLGLGPDNGSSGCYWVPELDGICSTYWSSTLRGQYGWNAFFYTGSVNWRGNQLGGSGRARCVRGG